MALFVNHKKLKAAATSMHQLCSTVRSIYPGLPDDETVEAATVFLYEQMVQEVFGERFAALLREHLTMRYKYSTPVRIDARVNRIAATIEEWGRLQETTTVTRVKEFTSHVQSVIAALLLEAGYPHDDPDLLSETYPRFENAVRRIKQHLDGIKRQSQFLMK